MPENVSTVLRCPADIETTCHPSSVVDSNRLHTSGLHTKCNFINLHASIHIDIHVYVWTYFKFHSSIHMKNTEKKAKNTDWILKQLSEEKRKKLKQRKKKRKKTPVLEFLKNIRIRNFFYRCGIPWAESPFWSNAEQYHNYYFYLFFYAFFLFFSLRSEWKDLNIFTLHSLYINTGTTITVRNISKLETKALASLLKDFSQNQELKSRCFTQKVKADIKLIEKKCKIQYSSTKRRRHSTAAGLFFFFSFSFFCPCEYNSSLSSSEPLSWSHVTKPKHQEAFV